MLALGLARCVVGGDPNVLVRAGLAGLLHDAGRIGAEEQLEEQDPGHCERGHDLLHASGLPREICDVALAHHERHDGAGHPQGLGGPAIPVLARIVALVNAFEKVFRDGQRNEHNRQRTEPGAALSAFLFFRNGRNRRPLRFSGWGRLGAAGNCDGRFW